MLLEITQICFYESDYVTIHSNMSIMTENSVNIMQKLSNINFELLSSGTYQKCYFKHTMTDAAVWLSCYVCIFAILTYLTMFNQCLTIFFSKNYVS